MQKLRRRVLLPLLLAALLLASGCGSGRESVPPSQTGTGSGLRVTEFAIQSRAVGRTLEVGIIAPPERPGVERPLLVFLHGAGGHGREFLGNQAILSTLTQLGARAPVVAFPDGEMSWWHDRASGDWGRYVVREVIPAVSRRYGADPRRVAIGGISMGGYGAYHLGLARSGRFCAVGGHSAGLWLGPGEEFPGAFDSRADYERNDVIAAVRADPDAFGRARLWNDYGDEDWFRDGNAAFVSILRQGDADLTAHVWPGGHEASYWNQHFPAYLRFYARALADC